MNHLIFWANGFIGIFLIASTLPSQLDATLTPPNYKVQKGDTFYGVAKKHNLPLEDLFNANPNKKINPALIEGEMISVPSKKIQTMVEKSNRSSPFSGKNAPVNSKLNTLSKKFHNSFQHPLEKKIPIQFPYSELSYLPHRGILFQETSHIQNVLATREGIVACIDYMEGYGNYIILKHPGGFYSVYGNLGKIHVNEGQSISLSQKIASTNPSKGLYFQINNKDKAMDPNPFIF